MKKKKNQYSNILLFKRLTSKVTEDAFLLPLPHTAGLQCCTVRTFFKWRNVFRALLRDVSSKNYLPKTDQNKLTHPQTSCVYWIITKKAEGNFCIKTMCLKLIIYTLKKQVLYWKVMHFELVFSFPETNPTFSYLIYTHWLNMIEKTLHCIKCDPKQWTYATIRWKTVLNTLVFWGIGFIATSVIHMQDKLMLTRLDFSHFPSAEVSAQKFYVSNHYICEPTQISSALKNESGILKSLIVFPRDPWVFYQQ